MVGEPVGTWVGSDVVACVVGGTTGAVGGAVVGEPVGDWVRDTVLRQQNRWQTNADSGCPSDVHIVGSLAIISSQFTLVSMLLQTPHQAGGVGAVAGAVVVDPISAWVGPAVARVFPSPRGRTGRITREEFSNELRSGKVSNACPIGSPAIRSLKVIRHVPKPSQPMHSTEPHTFEPGFA